MRRRPPPELDPDRLRSLLASARPRPEPTGRRGWVPSEEPPAAEGGWFDERSGEPSGEFGESENGLGDRLEEADGSGSEGGRHRPPPRVLTMPAALRGARVAVSVRAVAAFVLVLVLAVVFFAWARSEERHGRAIDRTADRTGDAERLAYNARLRAMAGRPTD